MREDDALQAGSPKNSIFFEAALYGLIALAAILMIAAAFSTDYVALLAASGTVLLAGLYAFYVFSRKRELAVATPGQMVGCAGFCRYSGTAGAGCRNRRV